MIEGILESLGLDTLPEITKNIFEETLQERQENIQYRIGLLEELERVSLRDYEPDKAINANKMVKEMKEELSFLKEVNYERL